MTQPEYNTLDDIQARKSELQAVILEEGDKIATLWHEVVAPKPSASKGELIANLVSNGITAIDGFLLVHKLIRNYGYLFSWTRRKRK